MSIYSEAQAIAASESRVLVMVSRGRGSLCMVRVLLDYVPRERLTFLHLRTYQTLEFINSHLDRIRAFFGIDLEVQPSRESGKFTTGKTGKYSKERDHWREHYKADLVAYGFRSDESVTRAVIMRNSPDGINQKSGECYPLKNWNRSLVASMATKGKFPMAEEYDYGWRDVSGGFTKETAVWLHDTHPADFRRACLEDPFLEAEYVRASGNPI